MAALDTSRSALRPAHVAGLRSGIFGTLMGKLAAWNDRRQTRNELWKLTDRELDDIGLSRGDIENVVRTL